MGATARAESADYTPEAQWEDCPAAEDLELSAVLHALSDPMRMRIVAGLAQEGERACKDFNLPIVKSTCAHHFRVLRESGVIRQRGMGTTRINSLRRAELDARFPGLLDAVLAAAKRLPTAVDV
jgi:DNA-binding transcriptional ArsR family regulator